MLIQIIISIFLGLIPEVVYFTFFLICTKQIKEKRILLCTLIGIAYILCMFIKKYQIIYYIMFVVLIYIILKILYKEETQIIDIFVFSISTIYLTGISYLCFCLLEKDLSNYYILLIVNRILLIIPFIFRKYFNDFYEKYKKLWNRNDNEKRPIKSITLRNISLITVNIGIFLLNIYLYSILNFL